MVELVTKLFSAKQQAALVLTVAYVGVLAAFVDPSAVAKGDAQEEVVHVLLFLLLVLALTRLGFRAIDRNVHRLRLLIEVVVYPLDGLCRDLHFCVKPLLFSGLNRPDPVVAV